MRILIAVAVFGILENTLAENKYGDHGIVLTGVPQTFEGFSNLRTFTEDFQNFGQNQIAAYSTGNPINIYTTCGVDYDMNYLYIYDYEAKRIELVENFNTSMIPSEMVFSNQYEGIGSEHVKIAVDWISHNVYWTDPLNGWVAMRRGGDDNDLSMYKIIYKDHLSLPRGLAVDPKAGYLFWCDSVDTKVQRASLTGENPKLLMQKKLYYPLAVTVDNTAERLYVADWTAIHSMNYDGTNRLKIKQRYTGILYDMAIYENVLFTTDITDFSVNFYDKTNGDQLHDKFGSITEQFYGICMYQSRTTPSTQDRCKSKGCSDICVNEPDKATCLCREGYKLEADGTTCTEDAGKFYRSIIFSSEEKLCLLDIRILAKHHEEYTTPHCFYQGQAGETITNMELNMATREVYFSVDKTIYSLPVGGSMTQRRIITQQNMPIISMSYNWIDSVIYFAMKKQDNNTTESIWTIQLGNNAIKEHRTTTNGQVRGLTTVPHEKRTYWIAGDSVIESADYGFNDIQDIQIVEQEVNFALASHIVHDPKYEKLHILDSAYGGITTVHYNGTYERYTMMAEDVIDFAIYKDYVMYIEHSDNTTTLKSADFYGGSPLQWMDFGTLKDVNKVYNIKVIDPDLQPTSPSPCVNHNGGCEQLCYPEGNVAVCDCQIGFVLDTDNKGCISTPVKDNFFIFSDISFNELYQVDLANPDKVIGISAESPGRPFGVLYDASNHSVYWSSYDSAQIWTKSVEHEANQSLLLDMTFYYAYPRRMAQDPSNGYIYFVTESWQRQSYFDSFIGVIDRDGSVGVIIDSGDVLSCLALHPQKGLIFWADTGDNPVIYKANMDGTNSEVIVKDELLSPNGMAIDYDSNRLYWSDALYNKIYSCEFDGSDVALFHEDKNAYILDLKIMDGYLYYVSLTNPHVTKMNLRDVTDKTDLLLEAGVGQLHSMDIYNSASTTKVPQTVVCNEGNHMCSHFCYPTTTGYGCGCIGWFELLSDGKTCENAPRCPLYFGMAEVKENDQCLRLPGNTCNFTCMEGYQRKSNSLLFCTSDFDDDEDDLLWDQQTPCEQIFCPADIQNGYLGGNCSRGTGEDCIDYMCNEGYEKNPAVTELLCQLDGTWKVSAPLCLEKCRPVTSSRDHAQIVGTCNRDPGDRCRVICDERYRFASDVQALNCQSGSSWDVEPTTVCEEIKCPDYIDNGLINSSCSMLLDAVCSFKCDDRHNPHPTIKELTCRKSGQWDIGGDGNVLCTAQPSSTDSSKAVAVGVGVGVGVLVLIIIIIIVVIFLCRQGKLQFNKSGGSSAKAPPAVSFENPRYNNGGLENPSAEEGNKDFGYVTLEDEHRI